MVIKQLIKDFNGIKGFFLGDRKLLDFVQCNPENNDFQKVHDKVCHISNSDLIRTRLLIPLVKNIIDKDIDTAINNVDYNIVNKIAREVYPQSPEMLYEFISKYCVFHALYYFPIWTKLGLLYINSFINRRNGNTSQIDNYPQYARSFERFKSYYRLHGLSYLEIQKFLWIYDDKLDAYLL